MTQNHNSIEEYEEISEKQTSKLGYLLLVLMAIFMIVVGQTVFSDLKKIPKKPNIPAPCISHISKINNLKSLNRLPICRFNTIDKKFDLDSQYNAIFPSLGQIVSLNKEISQNNKEKQIEEKAISSLNRSYYLSLQEKIANEKAIMDKTNIKLSINEKRAQIIELEQKNASLKISVNNHVSQLLPQLNVLTESYERANEYYKNKHAYYKLKVFLLKLLFVLPFFALSTYFYFKLKRKNSPYTIIFTAVLGASAILFLQIILIFLYEILPKEWLVWVFIFFMAVPFLRYIIYYASIILVIALFGGLVYFIQKKIFNPKKVAIRRLKDNKCPECSFTLDRGHNFCPKCGQQIKTKCDKCNNLKICYLSYCPHCGDK